MIRTEQVDEATDLELITRITAGEKSLFEGIIRRYNQRLYRIGMSILKNELETEEAMQITYISAYEHLGAFQKKAMFSTWLTRIMINQCYEQSRKEAMRRKMASEQQNRINMRTPENLLANAELGRSLESAIASLPEKYRLVFVLREIEDLSVKETSAVLDIEESNVKVRFNRAKTLLKENLANQMKDLVYSFHLSRCDKVVKRVMEQLNIG